MKGIIGILLIIILLFGCQKQKVLKIFALTPSEEELGKKGFIKFYKKSNDYRVFDGVNANRYVFDSLNNLLDGYWMIANDTIFFSPAHYKKINCPLKFPICVMNWKVNTRVLFVWEKNNDQNCLAFPIYYKSCYVYVKEVKKLEDDIIYSIILFNSELYMLELRHNKKEIGPLFDTFLNNMNDFDYTSIDISLKRGVTSLNRHRVSKLFKLPV